MKINELCKVVNTRLKTVCDNVFHEIARDSKLYPHIVFTIKSGSNPNLIRFDYLIDIDIWHTNTEQIETLADNVELLFNAVTDTASSVISPTFYLDTRLSVPDEDKNIKHRLVRVQAQIYVR